MPVWSALPKSTAGPAPTALHDPWSRLSSLQRRHSCRRTPAASRRCGPKARSTSRLTAPPQSGVVNFHKARQLIVEKSRTSSSHWNPNVIKFSQYPLAGTDFEVVWQKAKGRRPRWIAGIDVMHAVSRRCIMPEVRLDRPL